MENWPIFESVRSSKLAAADLPAFDEAQDLLVDQPSGGDSLTAKSGEFIAVVCQSETGAHVPVHFSTRFLMKMMALRILDVSAVLEELMADYLDVSALRKVQVQHAVMFNEDWSTPYEVCWQANGTDPERDGVIVFGCTCRYGKMMFGLDFVCFLFGKRVIMVFTILELVK